MASQNQGHHQNRLLRRFFMVLVASSAAKVKKTHVVDLHKN
jgi:hypothetical protein